MISIATLLMGKPYTKALAPVVGYLQSYCGSMGGAIGGGAMAGLGPAGG